MMARLDGRPHDVDFVSKWMLALLVIPGLALATYSVLTTTYEAEHAETQLAKVLPASSGETLKALAVATGHPCDKVCAIDAVTATRLKLTCGVGKGAEPCSYPRAYTLAIDRAPEPSR